MWGNVGGYYRAYPVANRTLYPVLHTVWSMGAGGV